MRIGRSDELPPRGKRPVLDGDKAIATFNVVGAFHAVDSTWLHRSGLA